MESPLDLSVADRPGDGLELTRLSRSPHRRVRSSTHQGTVASPLLANICLHCVFDLWVEQWRHREARGNVMLVRYADDSAPRRREGVFMS